MSDAKTIVERFNKSFATAQPLFPRYVPAAVDPTTAATLRFNKAVLAQPERYLRIDVKDDAVDDAAHMALKRFPANPVGGGNKRIAELEGRGDVAKQAAEVGRKVVSALERVGYTDTDEDDKNHRVGYYPKNHRKKWYAADEQGHEHVAQGEHGGEFAPKGQGGPEHAESTSTPAPAPAAKPAAGPPPQPSPQELEDRRARMEDPPHVRLHRAKAELHNVLREHPMLPGANVYHNTQRKYMTMHPDDPTGLHVYGEYTESRQRLHEPRIRENLKDARPAEKPVLVVMGGGPAVGKTTVLNNHIGQPPNKAVIDADGDKNALPEYTIMRRHGVKSAASHVHQESGYISHQTMLRGLAMGANATWDTTGDSGLQSLRERIQAAREAGPNHKIVGHYVTIPTNDALARAKGRFVKEGRWIPTKTVKAIHANVSKVFPQVAHENLFDELHLWDNRGPEGSTPTHVASMHNGVMTIHHPQYYQEFLAKAHETPETQHRPRVLPRINKGAPQIPITSTGAR